MSLQFSVQTVNYGSTGSDGKPVTLIAGVAPGPDGNLWFAGANEFNPPTVTPAYGRISPALAPLSLDPLTTSSTDSTQSGFDGVVGGPGGDLYTVREVITSSTSIALGTLGAGGSFKESQYVVPSGASVLPTEQLSVGADGNLYVAFGASSIVKFTADGHATGIEFNVDPNNNPFASVTAVVAGADGTLWGLGSGVLRRLDPANPANFMDVNVSGTALTIGADDAIWVADATGLTRVDPTTGATKTYSTADTTVDPGGVPGFAQPPGVPDASPRFISGPDGNLWWAGQSSSSIASSLNRFNLSTGTFDESVNLPGVASINSLTAGPDGNLDFSGPTDNSGNGALVGQVKLPKVAPTVVSYPADTLPDAPGLKDNWTAIPTGQQMSTVTLGSDPTTPPTTFLTLSSPPGSGLFYSRNEPALTPSSDLVVEARLRLNPDAAGMTTGADNFPTIHLYDGSLDYTLQFQGGQQPGKTNLALYFNATVPGGSVSLPDNLTGFHTYRITAQRLNNGLSITQFSVSVDGAPPQDFNPLSTPSGSGAGGQASTISFGLPAFDVFKGYSKTATSFDLDSLTYGIGGVFLPSDFSTDLAIDGSATPNPVAPGSNVTYTFTVTNVGKSLARNVVFTDLLPANATFASVTPSQGSGSEAGGNVTAHLGGLAPGSSATVKVVVTDNGGGLTNTASVKTDTPDTNSSNDSKTVTTNALGVSVLAKADNEPVKQGAPLTYTFTVSNGGPGTATGVVFTDSLAPILNNPVIHASQGSTEIDQGEPTAHLGDIPAGSTATITVTVDPTGLGDAQSDYRVTSTATGFPTVNGSVHSTIIPDFPAVKLTLAGTSNPDPVVLGQHLTYTMTVVNNDPTNTAKNVVIHDTLPDTTYFASTAGDTVTVTIDGVTQHTAAGVSGGELLAPIGDLGPGQSGTVVMTVEVSKVGPLVNTVTCSSDSPLGPGSISTTDIKTGFQAAPSADVQITVATASAGNVAIDGILTYDVVVTNTDPANTAHGVTFTFPLASNTSYTQGATASPSTANDAPQNPPGSIFSNIGDLGPGQSVTYSIPVRVTGAGGIVVTPHVDVDPNLTTDPNLSNNTARIAVNLPNADVEVANVAATPLNGAVGDKLTFLAEVKNLGPDTAPGVVFSVPIPANATFDSGSTTLNGVGVNLVNGSAVAQLGDLADNADLVVTYVLRITSPGVIQTNPRVDLDAQRAVDTDPNNNLFPISANYQHADVGISDGSVSAPGAPVGGLLTFKFTVTNLGPDIASGVVFTAPLPASLDYQGATDTLGDAFTNTGGVVTGTLGDLTKGESTDVSVLVKVKQQVPIDFVGHAQLPASGGIDDHTSNDSRHIPANAPVSLQIQPRIDTDPVVFGGSSLAHWTISNPGTVPATNVTVTIPTPHGITLNLVPLDSSVGTTSLDNNTLIFTFVINTLPPSGSVTIDGNVTPNAVETYALTATATADEPILGGGSVTSTITGVSLSTSQGQYQLDDHGGPVLAHVNLETIFYGSQWTTGGLVKEIADTGSFLRTIVNSPYMDFLSQYGRGSRTIGRGTVGDGKLLTSTPAPTTITDTQIQNIIRQGILDGTLTTPPDRLFCFYTPPGTVVSLGNSTSVSGFGAYHSAFSLNSEGGPRVYYLVVPYQSAPNGTAGLLAEFSSMTDSVTHELAEAVTDPDPGPGPQAAWYSNAWAANPPDGATNGEIGDLSANQNLKNEPEGDQGDYGMLDGYVVQYLWANRYTDPNTGRTIVNDSVLPVDPAAPGLALTRVIAPLGAPPGGAPPAGIHAADVSFSFSGPVATFVDPGHPGTDPGTYQALIDWGDGTTSAGDVSYDPDFNQYVVSSAHTFHQAAGSVVNIGVSLTDTAHGGAAGLTRSVPLLLPNAPPGQFGFDQVAVEAYRNGSDATLLVTRTGDTTLGATIDYRVTGGSAVAGVDYRADQGTLTFAPGQSVQVLSLPIYADPGIAIDQTVDLALGFATGNDALGTQSTAVVTIHPSADIYGPPAPVLEPASDTGITPTVGITSANGSGNAPLTFDLAGLSLPEGFAQLFDVTDPAHPVALGTPVRASGGRATVILQGTALGDGVHRIAVVSSPSADLSVVSPPSTPTTVTIDTVPPTATVSPLPALSGSTDVTLQWSGTDNPGGAGVVSYDIYVSDDDGAFTLFAGATTQTSGTFHGTAGHTYAFAAVATDAAGNRSTGPLTAQSVTSIAGGTPLVTNPLPAPVVTIPAGPPVAVGETYRATGRFDSLASGSFTATVNYGDGTASQDLALNPDHSFSLSHVYTRAGSYGVTVEVNAQDGTVGSTTVLADVAAPPPTRLGPPPPSGFGEGPDAFVSTLYREQLGRYPEPSGLRYWSGNLAHGEHPRAVATSIWNSREHQHLLHRGKAPHVSLSRSYADALAAERKAVALPHGPLALKSFARLLGL